MLLSRVLPLGLLVCGACCPEMESEYVPVQVPVYTGATWNAQQSGQVLSPPLTSSPAARSSDPCDQALPDMSACTQVATVRAGEISTQPMCYLDTKFHPGDIGHVMQCGSTTVIAFPQATFVGTSAGGDYLNVCKTTAYDLPQSDTCTWRTEQRITGSLARHRLAFSYSESPVAGANCTLACRAHARMSLVQ